MGVRFPSSVTAPQQGNITVTTTSETIIATLPPLNLPMDFATILLFFWFQVNTGTGVTGYNWAIRRGTALTGTKINVTTGPIVASASTQIICSGCYGDTPGAVGAQQYVLTYQQSGATGNATVQDPVLMAMVL